VRNEELTINNEERAVCVVRGGRGKKEKGEKNFKLEFFLCAFVPPCLGVRNLRLII